MIVACRSGSDHTHTASLEEGTVSLDDTSYQERISLTYSLGGEVTAGEALDLRYLLHKPLEVRERRIYDEEWLSHGFLSRY
jgi:hypothetical protein